MVQGGVKPGRMARVVEGVGRRGRWQSFPPRSGSVQVDFELFSRHDACPRQFQGLFFCFSWGCQRPISAARTVTIWTLPNGPSLLQLEHTSLSGIAFLSGPTCDRANRVTQACRLKRIASEHDRRSGRIGDFTDHLCPCPSILRWALPCGREGVFCERWQDRSVASDFRNPVADSPPTCILICIFSRFHRLHCTPHLAGNSPRGEGPGSLSPWGLAVPVELFLP